MNEGLFLVGATREVGKTLIGVAMVALLREMGIQATLMTPIVTGGSVESPAALLRKIGVEEEKRLVTPLVYETAASPYVASRVERKPVDISLILEAWQELRAQGNFVIVEGGGLLVPFSENYSTANLIEEMDLPALIVAQTARGMLNPCLLTLQALLSRGLTPAGFILNGYGQYGDGFAESLNPEVLEELAAPIPVLCTLEWRSDYRTNPLAFAESMKEQTGLMDFLRGIVERVQRDPSDV